MGFFDQFRQGLEKTRKVLNTDVRDLFKAGEILDETQLEAFEGRLVRTDMGVAAAGEIVAELRKNFEGRTVKLDEVSETINRKLRDLLEGDGSSRYDAEDPLSPLRLRADGPTVILVSGVNGVGKTTSIAKLSKLLKDNGKRVVLAAGDTFRAAAVEQLTLWAGRLGCEIVRGEPGADPASVAHRGAERLIDSGADVLIVDTAGRLQTQKNLMDQLDKVRRVLAKKVEGAPHESLLVIDATTGQNGLSQTKSFSEAAGCTGIVLAKLDGTAKGGVVIAIRRQMAIPVKYVGVGEGIDDFAVFNTNEFVRALEI
ncbi:MAG: signal recognition particle-docking protein FtsY [Planctomycetaceae bacterium]|nr:signal recognition particle-docking protein FtsY [Planctomycetaceae bacterium]